MVGIANSIDLTERAVPELKLRGCTPQLMCFAAYSKTQVLAILRACQERLPARWVQKARGAVRPSPVGAVVVLWASFGCLHSMTQVLAILCACQECLPARLGAGSMVLHRIPTPLRCAPDGGWIPACMPRDFDVSTVARHTIVLDNLHVLPAPAKQ